MPRTDAASRRTRFLPGDPERLVRRAARLTLRARAAALALLAACASGEDAEVPLDARPADWLYAVTIADGGRTLRVEAELPARAGERLVTSGETRRFYDDAWQEVDGARHPLVDEGDAWTLPLDVPGARRVGWTFDLHSAGRMLGDRRLGLSAGDATMSAPSAFLLRPPRGGDALVEVAVGGDVPYVSGLYPGRRERTWRFEARRFDRLPYGVVGDVARRRLAFDGRTLDVVLLPGEHRASADEILDWASRCAHGLVRVYGVLPVAHGLVVIEPGGRGYGRAVGNGGAAVHYPLDPHDDAAALARDWVLVHELVHLACPLLADEQHWLEEGLATYVEPLVRLELGLVDEDAHWGNLIAMLPYGLPREGDRGLDHTRTWGRTYWGGALFCLLADVGIRERSGGRHGLLDALRAIVRAGGSIEDAMDVDEMLALGDAALPAPVLGPLYEAMKADPHPVDLETLWRRLGVRRAGERVVYDDEAPLAAVRRAMTRAAPGR